MRLNRRTTNSTAVIRRPTPKQGRALELLGHAIEYLIDSHPMCISGGKYSTDFAAVVILKKASREVFAECQVSQSFFARLWKRFFNKLPTQPHRHSVQGIGNIQQDEKRRVQGSISSCRDR